MRHFTSAERPTKTYPLPLGAPRGEWQTLRALLPYLWQYKWRVGIALSCLVLAKLANVAVPIVLKDIVDAVSQAPGLTMVIVPIGLIAAYGLMRVLATLFTELREVVFARVTQQAVRRIALQVFEHLHALSLRFHLERQTGGLTRDIERGTRGVSSLVSFTLYSILPTIIEVTMVLAWLIFHYEIWFAAITVVALAVYVVYTIVVTNWRTNFRREMNDLDSRANTRAVDSLLNYETVKYFNNEAFEAHRYDRSMERWQEAAIKSQTSLSVLNVGQSLIISVAVTLMVWRATLGVVEGRMTLGDLVLVNAFMIQLYIPLNFLGVLYREIKQSLADMERMFGLMAEHREVDDRSDAQPLALMSGEVVFDQVSFAYESTRPILHDVSLVLPAGKTTAVVGSSGAGKSTLSRLLYRFYDIDSGAIRIDGQEIRQITQASLRSSIGIVPQDTVLFNDTLEYNIRYGRPDATDAEVAGVADAAHLSRFIASLPEGMRTRVGERGLKLSGGEKQRVAIARALLKRPAILIFDEATSALDSESEKAIQQELMEISRGRTTLVIAHRLSTIVDADQIVVLEGGRIVERGRHAELIARGGRYAELWELQAREARQSP
ncbi:MAG: ABC transporter ATP-binding protein/permease [Burkholderiaceae bacterium]|nr:ABC transporter ATP-binding protein/permease [Burkholderiaceae bacterium]